MSDSLWHHGLQHARFPFPSLSPRAYPDSCPLNQWSHPSLSSSVTLFSFCLQSFSASGSFPMSQMFRSSGQSIGASASALVLPKSTISFSTEHHSLKASILWCSASFIVQLSQPYVATGNTIALTVWTFVGKMSRFVLAFLPRSNYFLISWLQKSITASTFPPSICHAVMGPNAIISVFKIIFNIEF